MKADMKTADLTTIIHEPVNLKKLLAKLDFVDEEVANAAKEQPMLYLTAARFRIQKMQRRIQAESSLAVTKAQRGAKFRAKVAEGGERVTEGRVNEMLVKDKEVRQLEDTARAAAEQEEFAKMLLDAYRMRKDALKIVVDLMGAELYVQRSMEGTGELRKIKDKLKQKLGKKYEDEE
jgi:hypothetical protein